MILNSLLINLTKNRDVEYMKLKIINQEGKPILNARKEKRKTNASMLLSFPPTKLYFNLVVNKNLPFT